MGRKSEDVSLESNEKNTKFYRKRKGASVGDAEKSGGDKKTVRVSLSLKIIAEGAAEGSHLTPDAANRPGNQQWRYRDNEEKCTKRRKRASALIRNALSSSTITGKNQVTRRERRLEEEEHGMSGGGGD